MSAFYILADPSDSGMAVPASMVGWGHCACVTNSLQFFPYTRAYYRSRREIISLCDTILEVDPGLTALGAGPSYYRFCGRSHIDPSIYEQHPRRLAISPVVSAFRSYSSRSTSSLCHGRSEACTVDVELPATDALGDDDHAALTGAECPSVDTFFRVGRIGPHGVPDPLRNPVPAH